jgi:DNA-binding SARP family transcriptional activator/tetratricopeptide (TPR) repeat protein
MAVVLSDAFLPVTVDEDDPFMDFLILGPLEAQRGAIALNLGGPRQQAVLATLLLEAGTAVPVHRLIDAVWNDAPPVTAREQIQISVSGLRRSTFAEDRGLIETRSPGYLIRLSGCTLDANIFDTRVREGRAALAEGDPAAAAAGFRSALSLWRGSTLANIPSALVQRSSAQLNERRLSVLEECIQIEVIAGLNHDLVPELMALTQEHPLRERFRALLMAALYKVGRQAEAMEEYRRTRRDLMDELGIEPSVDLQRLHQTMLVGKPITDPTSAPASPTGTGTTGSSTKPAAPSAGQRRELHAPMLLPTDIPDFTGRSSLISQLLADMAKARNVGRALPVGIIFGRGGAGKTTLAVHLAHLLAPEFPDGQLFAQMQASSHRVDPAEILARFLHTLGTSPGAIPDDVEERAEAYRDLVSHRRILVVLDNAESEKQVVPLLPGCSTCAVLVTSRHRLTGLSVAVRAEVGPLSSDSAADLLTRIAGVDRVQAEPEAAAALCELCERLPLLLRITGARLAARPHWSIAALCGRLADESRRLNELSFGDMGVRASISVSYDALSPDARRLFRLLALSEAPSFAAWVGAPLMQTDPAYAEDLLDELTEAYLLESVPASASQPVRYLFHDITRSFALERLVEQERPQDRRDAFQRLAGAMLFLADEAHRREYSGDYLLPTSNAARWELPAELVDRTLMNALAWYEQERESIAVSVRQTAANGLVEYSWSLALSAVVLYESHSYFSDWRATHEIALKAASQSGDRRGEAAMRYSLGSLYLVERKNDTAARQFQQAEAIYRQLDDPHGTALVLRYVAYLHRLAGDAELALARWQEALDTFQAVGDRIAEAYVFHNMAQVRLDYGDLDAAQDLLARAARICEETGNRRVGAQVTHRLGALALQRGDLESSAARYAEVLESVSQSGDRIGKCHALLGLAAVDLRRERVGSAERLLTEAMKLAATIGDRMVENRVALSLAEAKLAAGELDAAADYANQARLGFEEIGAKQLQVRTLIITGLIYQAASSPGKAHTVWRDAAGLLSGSRSRYAIALLDELDRHMSSARLTAPIARRPTGPPLSAQ